MKDPRGLNAEIDALDRQLAPRLPGALLSDAPRVSRDIAGRRAGGRES